LVRNEDGFPFFRRVTSTIIRHGAEVEVKGVNGIIEQMYQVAMDYPGASDPLHLDIDEIRFYYRGLHNTLKQTTKGK